MEIDLKNNYLDEIKKLKNKINTQEKIILRQENKIKNLININKNLNNKEENIYKNELILKDMIQNLEIFISFFELDNIEYRIYGDFFEKLLINKSLDKSTINIYIIYNRFDRLETLCNIFYSLKKINNIDDYNLLKYFINDNGLKINYYNLSFLVRDIIINVNIHDMTNIHNYTTTSQNFCITNNGIENLYKLGNKNFYSSKNNLDLLCNLFLLKNKKTNLIYNNKKINSIILKTLSSQLYYEDYKFKIQNSFKYIIDNCPICFENKKIFQLNCNHNFCLECLIQHINNENYENKNCALCRTEMILK